MSEPTTQTNAADSSQISDISALLRPVHGSGQSTETEQALQARVGELQAQTAQLRSELDDATARARQQARQLETFKAQVVRVAMAKAREHNWCDVVTEALEEMGLEVPPTRVRGTFTITYTFTGEVDDPTKVNHEWIRDSLSIYSGEYPSFDGDWSNTDISVEHMSVDDWQTDED